MVSVKEDNWDRGLDYLDKIVPENRENTDVINLKGIILFNQGRYEEALSLFRKNIIINSDDIKSRVNIGAAFCLTGEYDKAGLFLTDAHNRNQLDIMTLLWLIETGLRTNDDKSVYRYSQKLCSVIKTKELLILAEKLSGKKYSEDGILTPVRQEFIAEKIYEIVKTKADSLNIRQEHNLIPQKK
jgi:tetratricopeptide (TPR) repeat protein